MDSRKIRIKIKNGQMFVVHPHIVIRKKEGSEILKSVLESGDCLDIPLHDIAGISILPESFAINAACLSFDYDEYELVFPKKADWFEAGVRRR